MNGTWGGQQLGVYQLTRLLGKGGFGEVYEADHLLLQEKRAVKLLLERHFHDPEQRERFLREARILATLDHPNILRLLEVQEEDKDGKEDKVLYLVMPLCRRGTLHDLLKQRTIPFSLPEVERFFEQICAAVGYAHTQNIVHLDLKPQNMLLHDDGRLVVSDFGLAHIVQQGYLAGGSSLGAGTPQYMAPEHIQGNPGLQSDLYALGVILYQLLTNHLPFMSTLPAELESVVRKAMKRKLEDRYATADALLADFHRAVSLLRQPAQPSVSGAFSPEAKPHVIDQTPNPPTVSSAPLTATRPARGVPLTSPYTLTQKKFPRSSMDVASPDGTKQKKPRITKLKSPSKMSGGLVFLLTLLLGVGWVWLLPLAVSFFLSLDHHVVCRNPLPGIIGALSALLFYVCVIAVLFAAPIGLSALIVGFLKKVTSYQHDDEMHLSFRALAIAVVAIIIDLLIIWLLQICW